LVSVQICPSAYPPSDPQHIRRLAERKIILATTDTGASADSGAQI
jgi:hypothetical protein